MRAFLVPEAFRQFWHLFPEHFTIRQLRGMIALFLLILFSPALTGVMSDPIDFFLWDAGQWIGSLFRAPDPRLVVIGVDEKSIAELKRPWPWPRELQADLLRSVNAASPSMVICDILYHHPETSSEGRGDVALEAALAQGGNAGLISLLIETNEALGKRLFHFPSLKGLRKAAKFEGFVWAWPDRDERYRSFVVREGRMGLNSCVAEAAGRLGVTTPSSPLQVGPMARSLITLSRRGGGIPLISASDLLLGRVPPDTLKGRVIFIGVTSGKQRDVHGTILGEMPGTVLLAHTLDTILRQGCVFPVSGSLWTLGMILAGFIFSFRLFFTGQSAGGFRSLALLVALCAGIFPIESWIHHHLPLGVLVFAWGWTTICLGAAHSFMKVVRLQNIQREADTVGELQRLFFPGEPWKSDKGYECYAVCQPCDEAGGDYVDYFPLPDQSLMFGLGDVSGHGFAAGMVTAMAKAIVTRSRQEGIFDPDLVVDSLNQTLLGSLQKVKMMTVILGHLDPERNLVKMRFAGHLPAYHLKAGGEIAEIAFPSFPLGTTKRKAPGGSVREIALEKGDMLVLYTDGFVEAVDWDDQLFSFPRWQALLKQLGTELPLPEFARACFDTVRQHGNGRPFQDDVSMLVIRRVAGKKA